MLELDSVLYVGGVPRDMYNSLPVGILSRQGFEGCMSSLDLPGESPSLMEDAVVPSSSLVSGCEGKKLALSCGHHISFLFCFYYYGTDQSIKNILKQRIG